MTKGRLLLSLTLVTGLVLVSMGSLFTKEEGTPIKNGVGYTGGIREQGRNCAESGCHFVQGGGNLMKRDGMITSNVPPEGYNSGTTYDLAVTLTEPFRIKYGYMASPQANNAAGDARGSVAVVDDSSQLRTGTNYIAVTHTLAGTAAPNETKTWNFKWTAPTQIGLGEVLMFAACNASNNDDTSTGDRIYLDTLFIPERVGNGFEALLSNMSISCGPNPTRGLVTVNVQGILLAPLNCTVYNLAGNIISESRVGPGDQQSLKFDLSGQPVGNYLLRLRSGEQSTTIRLVRL